MEKRAMYSMGIMPMEEDNVKKEKIGIRETRACFLFNTCIFGICGFCVLSIY